MAVDHFKVEHFAARTHEKMMEVLMNPRAKHPKNHYYMIRGGKDIKNITVWEFGTIGGEYIKTYGHYHVGDLDETYWIVWGQGIALLQKRAVDKEDKPIDNQIEDFKAIKVKAGDKIYMPKDYGHLLVNTGKTYLVTVDDSPVYFEEVDPISLPGHADYEPVRKLKGFAYYVVEKKGKPCLVRNPRYKKVPKVKITLPK
jgi:oxalate decarboxylase/phosphoglucose isomerase-like protein (cupin superfamily)